MICSRSVRASTAICLVTAYTQTCMRLITTNRHNSFDYSTDRQHAMRLLRDVLPTPVQSVQRVGHQSALALGFNWARACAEKAMTPCRDKCVTEPDETQRVSYTLLCLPTLRQVQHRQRNAAVRSRTRRQRYSSARRARSDIVQREVAEFVYFPTRTPCQLGLRK